MTSLDPSSRSAGNTGANRISQDNQISQDKGVKPAQTSELYGGHRVSDKPPPNTDVNRANSTAQPVFKRDNPLQAGNQRLKFSISQHKTVNEGNAQIKGAYQNLENKTDTVEKRILQAQKGGNLVGDSKENKQIDLNKRIDDLNGLVKQNPYNTDLKKELNQLTQESKNLAPTNDRLSRLNAEINKLETNIALAKKEQANAPIGLQARYQDNINRLQKQLDTSNWHKAAEEKKISEESKVSVAVPEKTLTPSDKALVTVDQNLQKLNNLFKGEAAARFGTSQIKPDKTVANELHSKALNEAKNIFKDLKQFSIDNKNSDDEVDKQFALAYEKFLEGNQYFPTDQGGDYLSYNEIFDPVSSSVLTEKYLKSTFDEPDRLKDLVFNMQSIPASPLKEKALETVETIANHQNEIKTRTQEKPIDATEQNVRSNSTSIRKITGSIRNKLGS